MLTRPRFRSELAAEPVEEAGYRLYDVVDPRSAVRFRFFDFEYHLAREMDGERSLSELAAIARLRLGLATVADDDVGVYAERLADLGFVEWALPAASQPQPEEPRPGREVSAPLEEAITHPRPMSPFEPSLPPTALPMSPEQPAAQPVAVPSAMAAALPTERPGARVAAAPQAVPPGAGRLAAGPEMEPTVESTAEPAFAQEVAVPGKAPLPGETTQQVPAPSAMSVEEPVAAPSGRALRWLLGIVILVLLVVAFVLFVLPLLKRQSQGPLPPTVRVAVVSAATVPRLYRAPPAALAGPAAQTLSFSIPGKLAEVAAAGTQVQAKAVVARLVVASSLENDIGWLRLQEGQMRALLARAQASGRASELLARRLEAKRRQLGAAEAQKDKAVLRTPTAGEVTAVLVRPPLPVAAGRPVVEVRGRDMIARFTMATAEVTELRAPSTCELLAPNQAPGSTPVAGTIERIDTEGASSTIWVSVPEGRGDLKLGDQLGLLRSREAAFALPAAALSGPGGAAVLVYRGGRVSRVAVSVLERRGDRALVQGGLQPGQQVVLAPPPTLLDGAEARPLP